MKRFSLQKNIRKSLFLVGMSSLVSLGGCSNNNQITNDNFNIVADLKEEEQVKLPEIVKEEEKTYNKDDLRIILLWGLNGNLEYRVVKLDNNIIEKNDNELRKIEQINLESFSHPNEHRSIVNFNYYVLENNEKMLYKTVSNGIYLDEIYTLPDSDLGTYYGIISLDNASLPLKYRLKYFFKEEDILELENLLNTGKIILNKKEINAEYNVCDLELINCEGEYLIVDKSKAIYGNNLVNNNDFYYNVSVTDFSKAVRYDLKDKTRESLVFEENDYALTRVSSSNKEENMSYYHKLTIKEDLNIYLNDLQKLTGKITYQEIINILQELNYGLKR